MKKSLIVLLAVLTVSAPILRAAPPREVTDEDVDRTIDEIKRFLWARQGATGDWPSDRNDLPGGATTALALFALLEAGENPADERIKKGLDALVKLQTNNLYVISVRTMVLSKVSQAAPAYRDQLVKDIKWLTEKALAQGGAWGYGGPERNGDNSCSQFALLALWEADRAKMEINPTLVKAVEQTWLKRQQKDGGWTYAGQPGAGTGSTLTMGTAGLASLYVCQDVLNTACAPYVNRGAADKAWEYVVANLKGDYVKNEYLFFCVQRIGMASGAKFVGDMDWFSVGAAKLAEPNPQGRNFNSQWGANVRACLELVFLARGRIPLSFNKLEYGTEANWAFHSRDVANFTEYMRRNMERPMRWQSVKITDDVRQLLDAPILLVAGTAAVNFSEEDWGKLREYTLRGGTLLFVPSHENKLFHDSVTAGLEKLYTQQQKDSPGNYKLEALPADHPLYSAQEKIAATAEPMMGVSDGTRLLAVVMQHDICCGWHKRLYASNKLDFATGVNFYLYATGANSLRMRLRPVFVSGGGEAKTKAKVAWVQHGGNWNVAPYGLNYVSDKLLAENRVSLDVSAGVPMDAAKLNGFPLAWLTGSKAVEFTDAEVDALRQYVKGGGTLFINAVGGAPEFQESADKLLEKLFAGWTGVSRAPTSDHNPLMTGKCGDYRGPAVKTILRTRAWQRAADSKSGDGIQLMTEGNRILAIYSPYGLHDTLDGHMAFGAMSFMPTTARDLAANIVLYSLTDKTQPLGTQPASQPASVPATKPAEPGN